MEYMKLAFLIVPVLAVLVGFYLMLRRYNPTADRCAHGRLMGEGHAVACEACAHREDLPG